MTPPTKEERYQGVPKRPIDTVFYLTKSLLSERPSVEEIIIRSETKLPYDVVVDIWEGAMRLIPADNSWTGRETRKKADACRAARASKAENAFVRCVRAIEPMFRDENELRLAARDQYDRASQLTPDIRFDKPTLICGMTCHWVEYKAAFGYKASPFMFSKNVEQYRKYRKYLGPGMVVYQLGYQKNLFDIEGVQCLREAEVLAWLKSRQSMSDLEDAMKKMEPYTEPDLLS